MADQTDVTDKQLDKTSDSKAGDSAVARDEAQDGMEALADDSKNYYAARKGGMRDQFTSEILGAQPQFFDSAKESLSDLSKNVSPEMLTNQIGPKGDTSGDKAKDGTADKAQDTAPTSDQIMKDMDKLDPPLSPEKKAQMQKDLADIDKLPPEQRDKIHESLDKIANKDNPAATHLDEKQRAEIASSLAHQIAHPEDIKQGNKDTCVGANAEKTMATEHPEVYADMVAKLSVDGKYTAPGGKEIHANVLNDKLQSDTARADGQSVRSQASDVFQTGAMNLGMEDGKTYKSFRDQQPHETETDKDGKESRFRGLDAGAKEKILNQLCPDKNYQSRPIDSPADLEKAYHDNKDKPLNVTITQGEEGAKFSGMDRNDGAQLTDEQAKDRAAKLAHAIGDPTVYYSKEDLKKIDDQLVGLNAEQVQQVKDAFKNDKVNNPDGKSLDEFVEKKMDTVFTDDQDRAEKAKVLEKLNEPRDPSKGPTHAVTVTKIENGKVYYENTADSKGKNHTYPNGEGVPIDDFVKAMKSRKGTASVPQN